MPPDGAGPVSNTVPVMPLPPVTVLAESDTLDTQTAVVDGVTVI